jgi:hypothetical protein
MVVLLTITMISCYEWGRQDGGRKGLVVNFLVYGIIIGAGGKKGEESGADGGYLV